MKLRESSQKKQKRNLDICIAVLEGATLAEVAAQHDITGPRVGSILSSLIFNCRRRYKNATGKSSELEPAYLKDLRLRKDEYIAFIKKWGGPLTKEDIWSMDIPLLNKIFWDVPNRRPCESERKRIKALVEIFPEDVFHILNAHFDKYGWQVQLTYANRLFSMED